MLLHKLTASHPVWSKCQNNANGQQATTTTAFQQFLQFATLHKTQNVQPVQACNAA